MIGSIHGLIVFRILLLKCVHVKYFEVFVLTNSVLILLRQLAGNLKGLVDLLIAFYSVSLCLLSILLLMMRPKIA